MSPFAYQILFWIASAIMLGFGAAVVFNRNPVASALSLVSCFVALTGLYCLLEAFFIGVVQILVYAGAVMVLFLFIIMLLDLKAEVRRKINKVAFFGGIAVTAIFILQLCAVLNQFPAAHRPFPVLPDGIDDLHNIGMVLFSGYNVPLQIMGGIILVSTIGVVVLSKRELK